MHKMKLNILFCLCFISLFSFGQNEPFSYLVKLELNESWGVYLKYNSETSEVFNKQLKDLDESDPLYTDDIEALKDIKVVKTKIDNSSKDEFVIVFSFGPSADPAFFFYKSDNLEKIAFSIPGLQLSIPGNGNIYISGHANNCFDTKKKYQIVNDTPLEIKQPYYYVGLKTKTLKPIVLYDSEELNNIIANLPENYDIEVLLNDLENNSLFLVKTEFGLTGWVDLGYIGQKPDKIDKIYFNGD